MRLVSYQSNGGWRSGIQAGDLVADTEQVAASAGWSEDGRRPACQPGGTGARSSAPACARRSDNDRTPRAAGKRFASAARRLASRPPVPDPQKIICLGLNHCDHAQEAGLAEPSAPMFFAKWANSLIGPTDAIIPPTATEKVDYEAELAVVIGKRARKIETAQAPGYIAGAMAFNDVSVRDLQMADPLRTGGKATGTFGPCGPSCCPARSPTRRTSPSAPASTARPPRTARPRR